jgi:hypothetical protein
MTGDYFVSVHLNSTCVITFILLVVALCNHVAPDQLPFHSGLNSEKKICRTSKVSVVLPVQKTKCSIHGFQMKSLQKIPLGT